VLRIKFLEIQFFTILLRYTIIRKKRKEEDKEEDKKKELKFLKFLKHNQ
jgi:hypothetical protein